MPDLINADFKTIRLEDGRRVVLSGREWCANSAEQRMELARVRAYDEERGR